MTYTDGKYIWEIYREFYFGIGIGFTKIEKQSVIILPFIIILVSVEKV